jgi:proline dehydrogenase
MSELGERSNAIGLDFEDTAAAFADRNDRQLRRRYHLLRLMGSPGLTNFLSNTAEWLLKHGFPIQGLIRKTIFQEFCGGETFEDCIPTVKRLRNSNINSILDHAVEAQSHDEAFEIITREIIRSIELAKGDDSIPFAVFKVTAIARSELLAKLSEHKLLSDEEKVEWERAKRRIAEICNYAQSAAKRVLIDGEESWIQDAIDTVSMEMMEEYNKVKPLIFNTIQLYRVDRLEFLKRSHQTAVKKGYVLGIKVVRGAYMEKERERAQSLGFESPIHPTKEATDIAYNQALAYCVENVESLAFCLGSHNQESFELLVSLMEKHEISPSHPHVVCAQLLGMGDNLSYVLAMKNYNVAKLIPYGAVAEALPYLIRRAKENTSVVGQIGRELRIVKKELHRRGLK